MKNHFCGGDFLLRGYIALQKPGFVRVYLLEEADCANFAVKF